MNGKYFIHVLLLLAMIGSQMATNTHMISHMSDPAIDCELTITHLDSAHDGHHHHCLIPADSHSTSAISDNAISDNAQKDCSIYHAYAGVSGITPNVGNGCAIQVKSVLDNHYVYPEAFSLTLLTQHIRGPPSYS